MSRADLPIHQRGQAASSVPAKPRQCREISRYRPLAQSARVTGQTRRAPGQRKCQKRGQEERSSWSERSELVLACGFSRSCQQLRSISCQIPAGGEDHRAAALLYLLLYQARELWAQDFEFIRSNWVELRGFEPLTSCMPSPHRVAWMVLDVGSRSCSGQQGPAQPRLVATESSYRRGGACILPSVEHCRIHFMRCGYNVPAMPSRHDQGHEPNFRRATLGLAVVASTVSAELATSSGHLGPSKLGLFGLAGLCAATVALLMPTDSPKKVHIHNERSLCKEPSLSVTCVRTTHLRIGWPTKASANGECSDPAIPSIGAAESLSRLRGKGLRGAKRRDATVGSALARDLARLQDRGAGGMAPLAVRAPP